VPAKSDIALAFFSENNLSQDMRLEYAIALQEAGIYNFRMDILSEEQIKNSVEIRLNYKEERGKFNRSPTLILKAEFLKNGQPASKFVLTESSDKLVNNPRNMKNEIKLRKKILLERFLEETKRINSERQLENNNA
jgi:hypothetical protein